LGEKKISLSTKQRGGEGEDLCKILRGNGLKLSRRKGKTETVTKIIEEKKVDPI